MMGLFVSRVNYESLIGSAFCVCILSQKCLQLQHDVEVIRAPETWHPSLCVSVFVVTAPMALKTQIMVLGGVRLGGRRDRVNKC